MVLPHVIAPTQDRPGRIDRVHIGLTRRLLERLSEHTEEAQSIENQLMSFTFIVRKMVTKSTE